MKIYNYEYLIKNVLKTDEENLMEVLENKEDAYKVFEIPKKRGTRCIHGLKKNKQGEELKSIQKNLCHNFLNKCPLPTPAKGFIKKENYQAFLQPHVNMCYFMKIDIKNFFDSFSSDFIEKILNEHIKDDEAIQTVIDLCTIDEKLPQGAVTSPVLSNIVFTRIDQRIMKYCQAIETRNKERMHQEKNIREISHINYTRYADDMLFSSDFLDFETNLYFIHMISKILKEHNFEINRQKTIICKDKLVTNGYVISDCIYLSRNKTRNIRKIIYCFRDGASAVYKISKKNLESSKLVLDSVNGLHLQNNAGDKIFTSIQGLTYYLSGCRSWLISIVQMGDSSKRKIRDMQKMITKIEMILEELVKLEV